MIRNPESRLPIDYLLRDRDRLLAKGAEMLECGESGDCYFLNKSTIPELSTRFTPRDPTRSIEVIQRKYRY